MRVLLSMMMCGAIALAGCSKGDEKAKSGPSSEQPGAKTASAEAGAEKTLEIGCGSCIYNMAGVEGCVAAVKIDGKAMLITGVKVDAHGIGLCRAAKQAVVAGKVEGDKFVATKVELVQ